jgi:23S rRNA pseudouridine2605 synthase
MARHEQDTPDLRDATRGERIQRVLADAGIGSRRACEALIEQGEVTINGRIETELPMWVDLGVDRIVVSGKVVSEPERRIYVMLNKPARTLSSIKDEPGADRRTVSDLVDHPASDRLFPVGRLDYDTVGLILMTNDGELANRLTHPRYGVPKTYRVVVKGSLDEQSAIELERGIYLADRRSGRTVGAKRTAHVELEVLHSERDKTTIELTLREGRNRQVRRMLAAVGYPVRSLERVAMGPVRLKGLARGQWRELTRDEIKALRKAAASKPDDPSRSGKSSSRKKPMKGAQDRSHDGAPSRSQELTPNQGIRRRSMKNAINRGDRPAGERRRSLDDDGDDA